MKITLTHLDSFDNIHLVNWQNAKIFICCERKWLLYQFFFGYCLQVHLHRHIYFWITYKNYCKGLLFRRFYFPSGPMELARLYCHYICVSTFFEMSDEYSLAFCLRFEKINLLYMWTILVWFIYLSFSFTFSTTEVKVAYHFGLKTLQWLKL